MYSLGSISWKEQRALGQMESPLITTICWYSVEVMCGRKHALIWEWLVDMLNEGKEF